MEVRIQSVVVEFILNNTEALFSPKLNSIIRESTGKWVFKTVSQSRIIKVLVYIIYPVCISNTLNISTLGNNTLSRPKSLMVCSPSTKLLSIEEAQARTQVHLSSPATTPCLTHSDYIEVGEGPGALLGKFHTVIELPIERLVYGRLLWYMWRNPSASRTATHVLSHSIWSVYW